MATVTKRDLVVKVSNETGLTQQQVFNVIQKTLDEMTTSLSEGNEVVLRNFGAFQVRRNPNKPGTDVIIPPRAVVKFRPGKEMKEKVAKLLPELEQ